MNPNNPEENEDPANYTFIFATVEDNEAMLKSSPQYLQMLASMPEDQRKAYRYGDWNAVSGAYFKEFSPATHTVSPFRIPDNWTRYRSFDYGLDLFACMWFAVDSDGRSWLYREYEEKDLIVSKAAQAALDNTLMNEKIMATYCPPDMFNRQKDTGRTMAEIFLQSGLQIVKSDNNRVQGHMLIKQMFQPIPLKDPYVRQLFGDKAPETLPGLMIFNNLKRVMSDIADIQADEDNPNDCAKQPHEVTHTVDSLRYYAVTRVIEAETEKERESMFYDDDEEGTTGYVEYMTGGAPTESYMNY